MRRATKAIEKGHPWGDGASMLVWCTNAVANLVVGNQLLLESIISVEDVGRHPSCPGQGNNKRSDDLIKALVDINAASCDLRASGSLELEVKLGKVPAFLSSSP